MSNQTKNVSLGWVIKNIVWPGRKSLVIGLGLIIVSRLASLVLPQASKYLMDDVIVRKDMAMLKWLLMVTMIAIIVQAISSFLLTRVLSIGAQQMIAEFRTKIQKKVLSLPLNFFDNNKSGALVSRIMRDVEGVRNLVGTGLVHLMGGSFTAVLAIVFMFQINVFMTFIVLVPVVTFAIVALKSFGYIRPIYRTRGKLTAAVTGRLTETINGIRVIKGFNEEERENKTFEKGVEELFENIKSSLTATAVVNSSSTFLLGLASISIMGVGGYFMIMEQITVGEFLSFTLYLGLMVAPIIEMSNIGSQLTEALAGLDRTQEIMRMGEENNTNIRTIKTPKIKGEVVFDNVTFCYEEDKPVLHNINLTAKAGTVTALVGGSGSGKSTIASLAASFLNPCKGRITVDGQDLSKIDLKSYRQHLGVVFQEDFLFEGTIRDNIMFAKPDATEEELQAAIEAAYIDEFIDRFEAGLDTVVGERGVKLSGGQKQRISIARTFLANPQIIVLDEATSALDTESEILIQKSLNKLMENRTTFVIAHRLSTIQDADQILVIEQGKIEEQGNHGELLAQEGRYYNLYNCQHAA